MQNVHIQIARKKSLGNELALILVTKIKIERISMDNDINFILVENKSVDYNYWIYIYF